MIIDFNVTCKYHLTVLGSCIFNSCLKYVIITYSKFVYPKLIIHHHHTRLCVAGLVCVFTSLSKLKIKAVQYRIKNKTQEMDSENDGSTPGQEEEVFESPHSEEEAEEFDVAETLKTHPWHEENPETLLLFAAALKQFSVRTPATERPNFV